MDLPNKYRPQKFSEVLGQPAIIKSLQRLIKDRDKQAFLLTGPSGTGKTSLARICAKELGAVKRDLVEIDGAIHSKVEDWRTITAAMNYAPIGSSCRVYVVDECHNISKKAWESLLKSVEEPPAHVYWYFCSTELSKVPIAIRNRCAQYALRLVSGNTIFDRLGEIADKEEYSVTDEVLDIIVRECQGSVRQAIAFLEVCRACSSTEEAAELCEAVASQRDPTDLARGLMNQTLSWKDAVKICASLQDTTPAEGVRRMIVAWMCACLLKQTDPKRAEPLLAIIENFSTPFASDAKAAELLLPIGRLLLG